MERLQKVIAASGICSRRKAEELILKGKVKVNGKTITELGVKVSSSDRIEVENKLIEREIKEYYLLNKPREVITSTTDDKGRRTVVDLINTSARIYPVGRLDYDTTGALLLTNDGEFANVLMHPSKNIEKVYLAKLEGIIKGEQIKKLKEGIILDDRLVKPTRVKLKKVNDKSNSSLVEITIVEGLNHQVKRMFEAVGFQVTKLTREKIAFFDVKNIPSGKYRKLTLKEIARVYSYKDK